MSRIKDSLKREVGGGGGGGRQQGEGGPAKIRAGSVKAGREGGNNRSDPLPKVSSSSAGGAGLGGLGAGGDGGESQWSMMMDSVAGGLKDAWQKTHDTIMANQTDNPAHAATAATATQGKQGVHQRHAPLPSQPVYGEEVVGGVEGGLEGFGLLEEQEDPDVVQEEVFENERFQPFRLWGHSWPGHFLPSDRVGHWSDKYGLPSNESNMFFEQVGTLPRG